jgi:ATP phosphoribosyltransferase regulatory subunit
LGHDNFYWIHFLQGYQGKAMSSEDKWLLPEGVEEILPQQAAIIEHLRRRLLDQFTGWGYELVYPPMIEFLDSLLNGTGRDLERETFKITDQLTGRLMGLRADITPQVARMDAHSLHREGPVRLCYCSTSLRTRAEQPGGSRLPYQIGVELFGHSGLESDAEVIALMTETLAAASCPAFTLDLGHVGIYGALIAQANFSDEQEAQLFEAFVRKSRSDIERLLASADIASPIRDALMALPWLAGDISVLDEARAQLAGLSEAIAAALDELQALAGLLFQRYPSVSIHIDLGELRGYHYHTGCVFAAYVDGISEPLAKGGRYDHIGEVYGRARPATGFSADLKLLAGLNSANIISGILAEGTLADADFAAKVQSLREQGERVVLALPNVRNDVQELNCDRRLVKQGDDWTLQPL